MASVLVTPLPRLGWQLEPHTDHPDHLCRNVCTTSEVNANLENTSGLAAETDAPGFDFMVKIPRSKLLRLPPEETGPAGDIKSAEASKACRHKKTVSFGDVTTYLFDRTLSRTSVPTEGGAPLGMGSVHTSRKTLSVDDHEVEKRRLHLGIHQQKKGVRSGPEFTEMSLTDWEEEPASPIQPVPPELRGALLRANGVAAIDFCEEETLSEIQQSRLHCGCSCVRRCITNRCSCCRSGIPCQVNEPSFPCRCTRKFCGNSFGRHKFDSEKVRQHREQTLTRLALDVGHKQDA
ncbi:cysteine/serine-rich nuclear protein 3-like isoform X1 [Haemaphysalis longicornis]